MCLSRHQEEIQKVKQRRKDREDDKTRMEEELAIMERQRALADAHILERKEEEVWLHTLLNLLDEPREASSGS
jgi:hypothetical protein